MLALWQHLASTLQMSAGGPLPLPPGNSHGPDFARCPRSSPAIPSWFSRRGLGAGVQVAVAGRRSLVPFGNQPLERPALAPATHPLRLS